MSTPVQVRRYLRVIRISGLVILPFGLLALVFGVWTVSRADTPAATAAAVLDLILGVLFMTMGVLCLVLVRALGNAQRIRTSAGNTPADD